MGSVIENIKTKEKCQIFTTKNIVKSMLCYVGYTDKLYGKLILENSCGNGQFLIEIVIYYIEDCLKQKMKKTIIKKGLENNIFGAELDKTHFKTCIQNLNIIAKKYGINNVKWNVFNRDALREPFNIKFDFVVGNPPYVSYWDMEKSERDFIKKTFSTCQNGASDYCYAFLQESFNCLNDHGKLAYIIPNSMFKTKSGTELRELLKPNITYIYDFAASKLFNNVLTASAIIIIDRASTEKNIIYKNLADNIQFEVPKDKLGYNWTFKKETANVMYKNHRFGDFFKVSTGVATQCNRAFLLTGWEEHENFIQKGTIKIEKQVVRKAASPKSKKKGIVDYIIFPYYYNYKELCRYSEDDFINDYPNALNYLKGYKKDLEKRDADEKAAWFEYGRSQALIHINQEKLLISTVITGSVKVYELENDEVPYSGLYILMVGNLPLEKAKEILTSSDFYQYILAMGVNISGKSIRIVAKNICDYRW